MLDRLLEASPFIKQDPQKLQEEQSELKLFQMLHDAKMSGATDEQLLAMLSNQDWRKYR